MSNTEEIMRSIADENGKISRLKSMLGRQEKLLENLEISFQIRYKIPPEKYPESDLQGNERAFWDHNAITRQQKSVDNLVDRINASYAKIVALNEELEAAQSSEEGDDDFDLEM